MTERGILFSPAMVSAIWAGRKTMTRRLPPVQPFADGYYSGPVYCDKIDAGARFSADAVGSDGVRTQVIEAPYEVGDRLWVRETHFKFGYWERDPTKPQDGKRPRLRFVAMSEATFDPPRYPITARQGPPPSADDWSRPTIYKRPARFMFRKDARLNLIVEGCDFERLNLIAPYDADAEGLAVYSKDGKLRKWGIPDRDGLPGTDDEGWAWKDWQTSSVAAFARLWNSIHGPDAWDANPWVTATRFHIETPN